MVAEKVDWLEYFSKIKKVCPWSYTAYQKGEIKIRSWDGEWEHLGNNQAIVYTFKNTNRRRLKKLCKQLDTSLEYEWLWSEPTNGPFASPVPILIQQDRRKLFDARFNTGYYDEIIG